MKSLHVLLVSVACTVPNPNYCPTRNCNDAGGSCVPETDVQLCARVGATCEALTTDDNCGVTRTVECGSCSGTDACVANVCKAPVCSTFSFPNSMLVSSLNDPSMQDAVTGISADGKTVLTQRRASGAFQLLIGDSNGVAYTITDLSGHPDLAAMAITDENGLALSGDGLTIIGASSDKKKFVQSTRLALGTPGFGPVTNTDFAALNVTGPGHIDAPAISSDGLAFYFRITDSPGANGLYETARASKTQPFPAAVKLPPVVQAYGRITAVSSDRMTLFVEQSFQMAVLTRRSVKDPFVNPNFPADPPKVPGFRTRPMGDCQKLIGTSTSAGRLAEENAIYSK